jgi:hypothetical protein
VRTENTVLCASLWDVAHTDIVKVDAVLRRRIWEKKQWVERRT